MFCSECGEREMFAGESGNRVYPYVWKCKNDHNVLARFSVFLCPIGEKCIRTKDSKGFQTSCIPKEWNEKEYKDKNYFNVMIATGWWDMTHKKDE